MALAGLVADAIAAAVELDEEVEEVEVPDDVLAAVDDAEADAVEVDVAAVVAVLCDAAQAAALLPDAHPRTPGTRTITKINM